MTQLEWIDEGGVVVLRAKKMPYCWQPVFARVYMRRTEDTPNLWVAQGYISNSSRSASTGVLGTIPIEGGKPLKAMIKEVEWYVSRWFKGLGVEVEITPLEKETFSFYSD